MFPDTSAGLLARPTISVSTTFFGVDLKRHRLTPCPSVFFWGRARRGDMVVGATVGQLKPRPPPGKTDTYGSTVDRQFLHRVLHRCGHFRGTAQAAASRSADPVSENRSEASKAPPPALRPPRCRTCPGFPSSQRTTSSDFSHPGQIGVGHRDQRSVASAPLGPAGPDRVCCPSRALELWHLSSSVKSRLGGPQAQAVIGVLRGPFDPRSSSHRSLPTTSAEIHRRPARSAHVLDPTARSWVMNR